LALKKIKGSKKRFETKEEILTFSQRVGEAVKENPYWIVGIAGSILLILAIVWGVNSYLHSKEKHAQAEYLSVVEKWPSDDSSNLQEWDKLVQLLQNFIIQNQGTKPALNAQLDLARVLYKMKHYDESIKIANQLLKETASNDALRSLVRYHLALTYEEIDKFDDALAQWNALANDKIEGLEREVYWHLARLYSANKEYPKALEEYEKALKTSSGYPDTALIQEEYDMAKLKAGPVSKEAPDNPAKQNSSG